MPKKRKRDPNAPKRPLTAYFLWMKEVRPTYSERYNKLGVKDLAKQFGEGWRGLESTEREDYKARAKQDMNKWKNRMEEYKKTEQYKAWQAQQKSR